jgi:hypothetical protein
MSFADIEWPVLRGALIGLGIAGAVSAVTMGATYQYVSGLAAENSQYQAALNQIRDRYVAAIQERQLVERYWPQYRQLQTNGFVGEENRLNWVDLLHTLATRHRVLALSYEVSPRALAAPNPAINTGDFQLQGSEMTLRLDLLHEGNLLALLQDLSTQNAGIFNLKSCTIERTQPEITVSTSSSNLSAQCKLIWHTIQPPAAAS